MTKNILYTLIALLLVSNISSAQDAKVLVTSNQQSDIIIKWYAETIYTDSPVNIYRQEKGQSSWIKINQQPVEREKEIPQQLKNKEALFNILENKILQSSPADLDGITKFVIMLKSVEFPEFADFLGMRFVDDAVSTGKEYRYKITFTKNGNEADAGISPWIVAGKYVPAGAPDNFTVVQDLYSAAFRWEPGQDEFMGVYLYRLDENGNKQKLSSVPIIVSTNETGDYPEHFYTDKGLIVGNTYTYQITGIDYFGRESKLSPAVKITIRDITPPPAPDKVITQVTGRNIRLYWENENVSDLAGYNVYRSENTDTTFRQLNKQIINSGFQTFTDSIIYTGIYNYKVSAVDKSGNESYSQVYSAEVNDIFPPATPIMLTAVPDSGKVKLNWHPNTEPDLKGYLIYRTIDSDKKSYILLNAEPISINHFTDHLPEVAKNKFLYRVVAIDSAYNRSGYSDFAITRMPDIVPPQKPVIQSVVRDDNNLVVSWIPVTDPDIAGYNVYRMEDDKNQLKLNINLISGINLFTDRSAASGVPYEYYIVAVDSAGNESIRSDKYSAVLTEHLVLQLEFKNISLRYRKRGNQVQLKWEIRSNKSVKGFIVYRKSSEAENFKPLSGLIPDNEFSDKAIESGGNYYYQIRAFDDNNTIVKSAIQKITIP